MGALKTFAARLAAGDPAAAALAAAGPAVAEIAAAGVRRGMAAGVSPDGTPFRGLKRPRPAKFGAGPPLTATGLLAACVSAAVNGDTLTLRAARPGAAAHQFGSRTVPARPYLGVSARTLAEIDAVLAAEIARRFAGAAA